MAEHNKQESKLNRRSTSLRENLLRRKKAVKSRDESDRQNSLSDDRVQQDNDFISSSR